MIKPEIKKVGIVAKAKIAGIEENIERIVAWFRCRGIETIIGESHLQAAKEKVKGVSRSRLPGMVDLVIVLGGDGTILSTGVYCAKAGKPLLGINMGSLGFLTETTEEEMFMAFERILDGDYRTTERMMLHAEVYRDDKKIKSLEALNDIVLNNSVMARMIETEIYLDNEFVIRFRADGLIISTPTGSTAYSLSAGGPILEPDLDAVVITPICPHTLTYRPLVVRSDSMIEFINFATEGIANLTADGQRNLKINQNDRIRISRARNELSLINSPTKDFFQILNEKLHWGGKREIKK